MKAIYDGLEFNTTLEAKWAAFFDLANWSWRTNPKVIGGWKPDFRVTFECSHSECAGSHTLLVSILDVAHLDGLKGHPALTHLYGVEDETGKSIASAGAVFGANPSATYWEMSHGSGAGTEDVGSWVPNAHALWNEAEKKVGDAR